MDLGELKRTIIETRVRRTALEHAVAGTAKALRSALWWHKVSRWPVLRTIFGAERLEFAHALRDAERAEDSALAELGSCVVTIDPTLNQEATAAHEALLSSFEALCAVCTIWNIEGAAEIDRVQHRTSAIAALTRRLVMFGRCGVDAINAQRGVLHLPNAGGDVRVYPDVILIGGIDGFRLIGLEDCRVEYADSDFIEQETVPPDAETIGRAWLKSNKDGSPDHRFRDNRELPLVRYGHLEITSSGTALAVYQISNWQAAQAFARAMADYQWAIAGNTRTHTPS